MTPTSPAPLADKKFWRQPDWLAAILLTAIIAGFHFNFLAHAGGFWRDEVNLINLAHSPSLAAMKQDSFPVLMPLLVRGWSVLGLGNGDLTLRLLGMLIGLCIPAALWLAAWTARRSPPLLTLALLGFNSTLIVFGDSLRAYGLGCLLIMLTAVTAVGLLRQPSWWRTATLALLATLSVQTLFHNAILVGAICFGAWAICWRKKNGRVAAQIFLAGLAAALSLLPYVAGFIADQSSAAVLRTGLKSWRFLAAFQDALGFPLAQYLYVWALLAAALIFMAVKNWPRASVPTAAPESDASDLKVFAGTTVSFAFAGYVLFLWLAAFPSQSWYLLPLLALAAVSFEIGLSAAHGKIRAVFLGLVLATAVIALPAANRDLSTRFTNIDRWAAELNRAASREDYVVIVPWFCGITFGHYFQGATAWTTLPPLADYATHRYDLVKLQIQNTNANQPVLERVVTTLQSGHRVWILAGLGWMDVPDPGTIAPATLPPAPLVNSGWSETPYTMVWASQVAHLVGDHAAQFGRVQNPAMGNQIIENTELFMAEGWKIP
jgi:hypothetical protein